jgi:hypothetical protein
MLPGSTLTTPLPITCNGSPTSQQLTPATPRLSSLESQAKDVTSRESTSGAPAARAPRRPLSGTEPSTRVSGSPLWYVTIFCPRNTHLISHKGCRICCLPASLFQGRHNRSFQEQVRLLHLPHRKPRRLRLHPDQRPSLAQEPPVNSLDQLCRPGHQPQLASPLGPARGR